MKTHIGCLLVLFLSLTSSQRYEPTWKSLDSRPLPSWYDQAKVGILIHWGVYSVPSYSSNSDWFWWWWKGQARKDVVGFMNKNYPPSFSYLDFGKEFTAEFFNADKWADLFKKSGAKYVVLTAKHHEGYTLWPSKYSFGWNAKDDGPHRDLVGELSQAVRNKNLFFGIYYSFIEWFNKMYLSDKNNHFKTQEFINNKVLPELHDMVNEYKPSIFWAAGGRETNSNYFKSKDFLAWLYNESPVKDEVVVNDGWGSETLCRHGGFITCDTHNAGLYIFIVQNLQNYI